MSARQASGAGGAHAGSAAASAAKLYQFKLVLLGESAVGKSSLVLRFVKDQFSEYRESTVSSVPAQAMSKGSEVADAIDIDRRGIPHTDTRPQ